MSRHPLSSTQRAALAPAPRLRAFGVGFDARRPRLVSPGTLREGGEWDGTVARLCLMHLDVHFQAPQPRRTAPLGLEEPFCAAISRSSPPGSPASALADAYNGCAKRSFCLVSRFHPPGTILIQLRRASARLYFIRDRILAAQ